MRKYEPVWEMLKEYRTATIVADPSVHTRIFRAVRKEKFKDICYKVECSMTDESFMLERKSEGDKLILSLKSTAIIDKL